MPKATMHEDRFPTTSEHQIGSAGKMPTVQPVPIAQAMHESADCQLGPSVLVPNGSHSLTALGDGQCIHDSRTSLAPKTAAV